MSFLLHNAKYWNACTEERASIDVGIHQVDKVWLSALGVRTWFVIMCTDHGVVVHEVCIYKFNG